MEYGYFLITCLCTYGVAGQTTEYGLLGQSIMLSTGFTTSQEKILWKHNGSKVVEFDGRQDRLFGSYVDRVILDWNSADLEIEMLKYEDSGVYELEAFTNKVLSRSSYEIEVIDRVPKPIITCEMNRGSSSDGSEHQASLTCSAEERQSQSLLKFEWSSNGNVQSGRNLTISLGNEHDKVVYTCNVSNPLTTESAEFTAEECYPDEGSSAALVAGIIVPIILLGLLIMFFMLWRKRDQSGIVQQME
ncbi:lymphocyte function-associated antigen 3-like [Menidia menidia]